MAVQYQRVGTAVTIQITIDASDINGTASQRDKILAVIQRAVDQLNALALSQSGGLTPQITALQAQQATLPAALGGF